MKAIRLLAVIFMLLLFAASTISSCGDDDDDDDDDGNDDDDDDNDDDDDIDVGTFTLSSSAFSSGQPIPVKYSCENEDYDQGVSIPLSWTDAPAGTIFFAITMFDPDAADTPHWGVFDLAADVTELADGLRPDSALPGNAWEALVYTGNAEYAGPCPPPEHDPHTYVITIYALNEGMPDFDTTPDLEDMLGHIQERLIDSASLTGTYDSLEE